MTRPDPTRLDLRVLENLMTHEKALILLIVPKQKTHLSRGEQATPDPYETGCLRDIPNFA